MRPRKTACLEALVLEPHFAQSCARFLLLYCLLGWRTSLQRLKVAAHVLVKSWFAAFLLGGRGVLWFPCSVVVE